MLIPAGNIQITVYKHFLFSKDNRRESLNTALPTQKKAGKGLYKEANKTNILQYIVFFMDQGTIWCGTVTKPQLPSWDSSWIFLSPLKDLNNCSVWLIIYSHLYYQFMHNKITSIFKLGLSDRFESYVHELIILFNTPPCFYIWVTIISSVGGFCNSICY